MGLEWLQSSSGNEIPLKKDCTVNKNFPFREGLVFFKIKTILETSIAIIVLTINPSSI